MEIEVGETDGEGVRGPEPRPEGVVAFAPDPDDATRARLEALGLPLLAAEDLAGDAPLLRPPRCTTVHAFGADAARRLAPIARARALRLIVSVDADEPAEALRGEADLFLVPSRAAAQAIEARGVPFARIIVAPPGVTLRPMRTRRFAPGAPLHVVAVSPLEPEEGIDALLDAFAAAHRAEPALQLSLAGEGSLRASVGERIAEEGLGECVHRHGALRGEALRRLLDGADLFVSNRAPGAAPATLPAAMLEAMASGLSVVAPREGAFAEAIRGGVTGTLFRPGDRAGLLRALLRLARDPGLRIALGAAGRVVAEIDFDEERTRRRLAELYAGTLR